MGGDYKYEMQMIAEDLAQERYGKDFYDCTDDQQYELFMDAQNKWVERACDRADYMRKAEREGR